MYMFYRILTLYLNRRVNKAPTRNKKVESFIKIIENKKKWEESKFEFLIVLNYDFTLFRKRVMSFYLLPTLGF